jgi:hypothetical protein
MSDSLASVRHFDSTIVKVAGQRGFICQSPRPAGRNDTPFSRSFRLTKPSDKIIFICQCAGQGHLTWTVSLVSVNVRFARLGTLFTQKRYIGWVGNSNAIQLPLLFSFLFCSSLSFFNRSQQVTHQVTLFPSLSRKCFGVCLWKAILAPTYEAAEIPCDKCSHSKGVGRHKKTPLN